MAIVENFRIIKNSWKNEVVTKVDELDAIIMK